MVSVCKSSCIFSKAKFINGLLLKESSRRKILLRPSVRPSSVFLPNRCCNNYLATLRSSLHLFLYNSVNNSINTMNFWIIYNQADLTKSSPQSWIKFSDKNIEDSTNARLQYCRRISIFDDIFGTVKIQQGQNNLQSEANNGEVLRHQKSDGRTNGRKKSPLAR